MKMKFGGYPPLNGGYDLFNRPDKWAPNTEYDFGDGLYGIRYVFYTDLVKDIRANHFPATILGLPKILMKNILSYGGDAYLGLGDPDEKVMFSAPITSVQGQPTDSKIQFTVANGTSLAEERGFAVSLLQTYENMTHRKIDVWVKYTKK